MTVPESLRVGRHLDRDNDDLRSHIDLVRALIVGLATHASVLHSRNLALLDRAHEGFQLELDIIRRLYGERDILKADLQHLHEELETAKQTVFEADQWKSKFNVLTVTPDEHTQALEDELARAKADCTTLVAQLASRQSSELTQARQERDVAVQGLQDGRGLFKLNQAHDRATWEHADQAAIWRRLLHSASEGREATLRVRDALGARLVASVREAGGTLGLYCILCQWEREVEGAANVAVSVPADPRLPDLTSPDSSAAFADSARVPPHSISGDSQRAQGGLPFPSSRRRSSGGGGSCPSGGSGSRSGNSQTSSAKPSRPLRFGKRFASQVEFTPKRRSRRPQLSCGVAGSAKSARWLDPTSQLARTPTNGGGPPMIRDLGWTCSPVGRAGSCSSGNW
ncbi:unnamed protein product [Phytophthora fragariaefolia]|uniref:Unnamed protein product n=1 Tax=Phytophthora fragariaefolia TaxID=1490495 RepID=A0A9W6XKW5_9STRA|nr:unnamed protein product [Phytophthora fragariaefolia]